MKEFESPLKDALEPMNKMKDELFEIIKNAAWACEQIKHHHHASKEELLSLCQVFMILLNIDIVNSVKETIEIIKNKLNLKEN